MKQILQDKFELKYDGLYSKKTGLRAGCQRKDGYRNIYVNGKTYLEHRLVWCYVHGYMPTELDHIDRNKSNNSLTNLREATRSQNNTNKEYGVEYYKQTNRYRLTFKKKHIGYFKNKEDALAKRKQLEQQYCGQFAPI